MALLINGKTPADAAAQDLARKIPKERLFKTEMRKQLNDIANDASAYYRNGRGILDISQYRSDIAKVLRDNYRRIAKEFKNDIRKEIGTKNTIDNQVDANLADYIRQHSQAQAGLIIETTQKETEDAFAKALATLAVGQVIPNPNEVASEANKQLRAHNASRSETIAVTETQNMAETAKDYEASAIAGTAALTGLAGKMGKRWNAILDSRTRPAHSLADGQERNINRPFIVDGQRMMRPGDTSLGASAGNVINCRCSADYILMR